jgi:hypothetical protein
MDQEKARERHRQEKARARHRRYNLTIKGAERYKRYEEKHPERKERWSKLMEAKAKSGGRY